MLGLRDDEETGRQLFHKFLTSLWESSRSRRDLCAAEQTHRSCSETLLEGFMLDIAFLPLERGSRFLIFLSMHGATAIVQVLSCNLHRNIYRRTQEW